MPATEIPSDESFCYLTTRGRVTATPHTIEIWYAAIGSTVYMLAGSATSDWVRNLQTHPDVDVRIGEHTYPGRARVVSGEPEEGRARDLVAGKYQPGYAGDLSNWKRSATVVAVDLDQRG